MGTGFEVKLRFIYAGGEWPVAHADVHLFALGKANDPKSPFTNDFPIHDTTTDAMGWVHGSPKFDAGLKTALGVMKTRIPNLDIHLKNYIIGDMYIPEALARLIRIRIEDGGAEGGRRTKTYEASPGPYGVDWKRPPVAEFDGHTFERTWEFLEYVADRYSFLRSIRPPNLTIGLILSGSPPPDSPLQSVFSSLNLQFAANRRDGSMSEELRKSLLRMRDQVAVKVCREVSAALGMAPQKSLSHAYEAILKKIAQLGKSAGRPVDWGSAPSPFSSSTGFRRLIHAVMKSFGFSASFKPPTSPAEDAAALGAAVFLAGVIPRGYMWGVINPFGAEPNGNKAIDAVVGTSNACSEDEFLAHCDLMLP